MDETTRLLPSADILAMDDQSAAIFLGMAVAILGAGVAVLLIALR